MNATVDSMMKAMGFKRCTCKDGKLHSPSCGLSAGRPISALRQSRKEKLHAISLELGEAIHADILAEMHKTDPKIHKDDCRKMLDELCADKRMDKRVVICGGKKVFYTARPE